MNEWMDEWTGKAVHTAFKYPCVMASASFPIFKYYTSSFCSLFKNYFYI